MKLKWIIFFDTYLWSFDDYNKSDSKLKIKNVINMLSVRNI